MQCIRWQIQKLSLIRDQQTPWPDWTTRYNTMESRNILDWYDATDRFVHVSHGIPGLTYTLRLRRFVPQLHDMLYETWFDEMSNEFKRHDIAPYAVADMDQLHQETERYIDAGVVPFITKLYGSSEDSILWTTYSMACERFLGVKHDVVRLLHFLAISAYFADKRL